MRKAKLLSSTTGLALIGGSTAAGNFACVMRMAAYLFGFLDYINCTAVVTTVARYSYYLLIVEVWSATERVSLGIDPEEIVKHDTRTTSR